MGLCARICESGLTRNPHSSYGGVGNLIKMRTNMNWRELLQARDETLVSPWLGGRRLRSGERLWTIEGNLPRDIGWHSFKLNGRRATWIDDLSMPTPDTLGYEVRGYLVGDRVVADGVHVDPDPAKITSFSEPVALLDRGLDRFVRVVAGRLFEDGPLVFKFQDFPSGSEEDVLKAYFDRKESLDGIPNVSPALDAAFRMETWVRSETERRRAEIERQRVEEEARKQAEERRQKIAQQLGTGEGRRAMAQLDFTQAARSALALGGAEYLDHRAGYRPEEMVVTFRLLHRQFVCTCDRATLRIIDAGICLTDHYTGERGDTRFTLESLPAVILMAHKDHVLVVTRHAPGDDYDGGDNDDD